MVGFPLDEVAIRSKTGSAEVYGKQSTSWVASYSDDYVVVMMVSQGGTGSGTSGPAIRKIWEALYGVTEEEVRPADAAIPGVTPPRGLPTFRQAMTTTSIRPPARSAGRPGLAAWVLLGGVGRGGGCGVRARLFAAGLGLT
eukprot:gene7318-8781_t